MPARRRGRPRRRRARRLPRVPRRDARPRPRPGRSPPGSARSSRPAAPSTWPTTTSCSPASGTRSATFDARTWAPASAAFSGVDRRRLGRRVLDRRLLVRVDLVVRQVLVRQVLVRRVPGPASPGPATPGPASRGPASPGPAAPGPASPGRARAGPASRWAGKSWSGGGLDGGVTWDDTVTDPPGGHAVPGVAADGGDRRPRALGAARRGLVPELAGLTTAQEPLRRFVLLVVLVASFAVAEAAVVHVPSGRSAYTLTLERGPARRRPVLPHPDPVRRRPGARRRRPAGLAQPAQPPQARLQPQPLLARGRRRGRRLAAGRRWVVRAGPDGVARGRGASWSSSTCSGPP